MSSFRFRFLSSFSSSSTSYIPSFHFPFLSKRLYSQSQFVSSTVDVHNAVSSFNHMLCVNPPPPIIEFNKILGSLVKSNKNHYPTAISLFHHLELNRITPDIVTFNTVINCYCHLGEINFAFSLLGKILKLGFQPDIVTLTTLIKGLCVNGKVKEALHFHDHVLALGFS